MGAAPAPRTHTPTVAWALAANGPSPDKMRMDRAKREDDWPEFAKAINAEVDTLWKEGTWRLVKRKPGMCHPHDYAVRAQAWRDRRG